MNIQEIRQKYPQYEDMSDEQLAKALHAKYYSDMEFGDFAQRVGLESAKPSPADQLLEGGAIGFGSVPKIEPKSDGVGRQLGLAARYGVEGLTAIPAMVAQPVADVADFALSQYDEHRAPTMSELITGKQPGFRFGNQQQGVSNLLTDAGLPQPKTSGERVVGDASRALSAGGGITGTAQRLSNPIAKMISQAPGMQAAGEVAGGGGASYARERGASPLMQMLVGLGAGFGAPMTAMGGNALQKSIRGAFQPFTAGGRNEIAARILQEQSRDPAAAAAKLESSGEIVPGSRPTTGGASGDVGIVALEKGMRNRYPAEFGERLSQQNLARQRELDRIAGDETDITAARTAREEGTASARDQAFEGAPRVDTAPITAKADEILSSPAGARRVVRNAVNEFRNEIEGESDAMRLYEIRKDIGQAMDGKLSGDRSDYKLARRELIQLRDSLDETIESVAPGFRAYLDRYKELSQPINQMEVLQELQRRSTLAAPDISTGREFLSQAKFSRNLGNLLRDPDKSRSLTDEQVRTAKAVAADLDMGSAVSSSLVKAAGSDTMQNLSLANIIARGRASGSTQDIPPVMMAVMKVPLWKWIYDVPDQAINDILLEAMLDPKVAAKLLKTPTTRNANDLGLSLAAKARQLGYGALIGAGQTSQREAAAAQAPPQ